MDTMSTSELEQRAARTADIYRQWIKAHSKQMTLDERIGEAVAADLVGIPAKSLRGWRSQGLGPAFVKLAGRVTYRVEDLAWWVEAGRQQTLETLEV